MVFFTRSVSYLYLLIFTASLLFQCSCTSTGSSQTSLWVGGTQADDLAEAERFFDQGQYKQALMKYSSYVYSPFPKKDRLPYARYKLGLSHYLLEQYPEAVDTLQTLLKENPNHEMAVQAQEIIDKAARQVSLKQQELDQQKNERIQKILQLEQFVAKDPQNADYHFQLGNYFWENGQFSESVAAYQRAAVINPAYLENSNVKQRVRVTSQGQFMARDPLLERAQQEEIRVINTNLQVKSDRNWLGQVESVIISGEVVNSSIQDVNNVQVEVTLLDFFDRIQEVRPVPIGPLPAGARRPFSVQMNQYEGLGIDMSYRTRVTYTK